jgi:hypothetical protein
MWGVAVACLLGAACGDGSDSPADGVGGELDCSELVACGGDPTGTWSFLGSCGLVEDMEVCAEATVHRLESDFAGRFEIAADGRYQLEVDILNRADVSFPPACAREDFQSCDDHLPGFACTGELDVGCDCQGESRVPINRDRGTWTVEGSRMFLASDSQAERELDFCVSGTGLRVREPGEESVIVLAR